MAIIRQSLDDIRAAKRGRPPLQQATDEAIANAISADPDMAPEVTLDQIIAPKNLRRRLNMTQEQFAEAIGLPVATLRNWEQGRNSIDPAGKSLLILLARDPDTALATRAAARAAERSGEGLRPIATNPLQPAPVPGKTRAYWPSQALRHGFSLGRLSSYHRGQWVLLGV